MSSHVERWRIKAEEWAKCQQAADMLRETKNDVFAEIKSRQQGKSEAERDRLARQSPDWKDFRDRMIKAEGEARRRRVEMKYLQMLFDAWRTENANARRERSNY